jgi:uncharacterized protein
VRLTRYQDTAGFERAAPPFLIGTEAENNLLFGLTATLIEQPDVYGGTPYFALVEDEAGATTLAALRTPPYNLVLSAARSPAALDALVADLVVRYGSLPGVLGPSSTARAFVDRWRAATGEQLISVRAERVYELTQVIPPGPVSGDLRPATLSDRALLVDWMDRFAIEAQGLRDRERAARLVHGRLRSLEPSLYLWVDGEPVAMAGASGPTPTGIRIGPVYTPPQWRGRGYASACVARLSQQQLDAGRERCFLFTDLSNPVSNSIYRAIGYRPVCDMDEIELGRP